MAGQLIAERVCARVEDRPEDALHPQCDTAQARFEVAQTDAFHESRAAEIVGAAQAHLRLNQRGQLSFRRVNRRDQPGYDPGLQRHHLLPRQLLSARCFGPLFDEIGRERMGFDDFRSNGLLLPSSDAAAMRIGLPLHRGPHRDYNAMVIERIGQVEASWSAIRLRAPEVAHGEAVLRLRLLQGALRRRLLDPMRKKLRLNRFDPVVREPDFAEIDEMVDELWPSTAVNEHEFSLITSAIHGTKAAARAARSAFAF